MKIAVLLYPSWKLLHNQDLLSSVLFGIAILGSALTDANDLSSCLQTPKQTVDNWDQRCIYLTFSIILMIIENKNHLSRSVQI